MKVKTYVRVGYDAQTRKSKVEVSAKPKRTPLSTSSGYNAKLLPTVAFAVVFDVPDGAFTVAEQVLATITVPAELAEAAVEIKVDASAGDE